MQALFRASVWLGAALWLAYLRSGGDLRGIRTDTVGVLGVGLLIIGLALHFWSSLTLARHESDNRAGWTPLVDEGPYRYVRNPIYLAGIPLLVGTGMMYPGWRVADLVGVVVVAALFHVQVVRSEERALRRRLGAAYDDYCRRVPRWVPRLRRTSTPQ